MARRQSLRAADLDGKLSVLYHPRRHPDAHKRSIELLDEEGLALVEHSHASSPFEVQQLVKEGHGFALVREGSVIDDELNARPIAGVTWTVDTAIVYRKAHYPKTIPVLLKSLKQRHKTAANDSVSSNVPTDGLAVLGAKKPVQSVKQLSISFPVSTNRQYASAISNR